MNDTDKTKIIERIKAGEELPKEYIYKLFSDEEDVFLFWNGRKEDVTNIALPFHSIEQEQLCLMQKSTKRFIRNKWVIARKLKETKSTAHASIFQNDLEHKRLNKSFITKHENTK